MTLPALMIVFGAILVYGGWANLSVWALAKGDNSQTKTASAGGAATQAGGASAAQGGAASGPHAAQTR